MQQLKLALPTGLRLQVAQPEPRAQYMPHLGIPNLEKFHTQCVQIAPQKHQDPPESEQEKNSNHKSARDEGAEAV